MYFVQQGDVILKRVGKLPAGVVALPEGSKVLQRGETTGHAHRFAVNAPVTLYTVPAEGPLAGMRIATHDGVTFIEVMSPVALTHEEHKPVHVDPGVYQVDLVREYDYEQDEARRVVD
jgi:hypothetical protein